MASTVSSNMRVFRPSILYFFVALALPCGCPFLSAQTTLPDSPFLTAGAPAGGQPDAPTEPYQLTGISVVGQKTFVSIYETAEKHSRWIAVGESAGDIHVLSCNVATDQSVIRVGGEVKVLTLRKPSVLSAVLPPPSAGTVSVAQPGTDSATPPTTTNSSDEEQAREARMLVTDLLEISVQQRKAYEDAQKKAAEQADKP
jgi:hypothetical protein